jgi:nickel-dependent lactate racemase
MPGLGYVLLGIAGLATVLIFGWAAYLGRSGRKVPEPIDNGYQVFALTLAVAFLLNSIVLLLR